MTAARRRATSWPPTPGRATVPRWPAMAARLAFALVIVVAPFRARSILLPEPVDAVPAVLADVVTYAIDVLVVATLVLWVVARAIDRRPVALGPTALRVPALALVGLAWLTIPFGVEPALSVVGAIRITLGALLAVYVLNEVDGLDSIAVPIGLMLVLQGAVAIGQTAGAGPVGLQALGELDLDPAAPGTSVVTTSDGTRLLRGYGLSPHPNILGGFLAAGLVLLMGASTSSPAAKAVRTAIVAIAAAALLVTFSRGAWLGGLAGLGAGFAILAARPVGRRRLDGGAGRWLATAAIAIAVFGAAGWLAREAVASRTGLGPTVPATEERSIDERLEQIRLGWRVVADRPLSGAGASALPLAMRDLEPDFAFSFYAPHLVPLAVAGELGVAGGLAWLGLHAAPWVLLIRRRHRPSLELAAASGALATLTVVSLFDDYPWVGGPGRTLAWLVLGLWALAWTRAVRTPPRPPMGTDDGR